jgi:hypothetical protein
MLKQILEQGAMRFCEQGEQGRLREQGETNKQVYSGLLQQQKLLIFLFTPPAPPAYFTRISLFRVAPLGAGDAGDAGGD